MRSHSSLHIDVGFPECSTHTQGKRKVEELQAQDPLLSRNMAIWWINMPASLPPNSDNSEDFSHCLAQSPAELRSRVSTVVNWLHYSLYWLFSPLLSPFYFPVLLMSFPWIPSQINLRNSYKTLCLSSVLL